MKPLDVQIFVHTPNDEIVTLNKIRLDTRIHELKTYLEIKVGILSELETIYFCNKKMEDTKTLYDIRIKNGSVIRVKIKEESLQQIYNHTVNNRLVELFQAGLQFMSSEETDSDDQKDCARAWNKLVPLRAFLAFFAASYKGFLSIIVELLKNSAATIEMTSTHGRNVLHVAAYHGNVKAVSLLLTQGADYQQIDNNGATPLSLASANGHLACERRIWLFQVDKQQAMDNNNDENDLGEIAHTYFQKYQRIADMDVRFPEIKSNDRNISDGKHKTTRLPKITSHPFSAHLSKMPETPEEKLYFDSANNAGLESIKNQTKFHDFLEENNEFKIPNLKTSRQETENVQPSSQEEELPKMIQLFLKTCDKIYESDQHKNSRDNIPLTPPNSPLDKSNFYQNPDFVDTNANTEIVNSNLKTTEYSKTKNELIKNNTSNQNVDFKTSCADGIISKPTRDINPTENLFRLKKNNFFKNEDESCQKQSATHMPETGSEKINTDVSLCLKKRRESSSKNRKVRFAENNNKVKETTENEENSGNDKANISNDLYDRQSFQKREEKLDFTNTAVANYGFDNVKNMSGKYSPDKEIPNHSTSEKPNVIKKNDDAYDSQKRQIGSIETLLGVNKNKQQDTPKITTRRDSAIKCSQQLKINDKTDGVEKNDITRDNTASPGNQHLSDDNATEKVIALQMKNCSENVRDNNEIRYKQSDNTSDSSRINKNISQKSQPSEFKQKSTRIMTPKNERTKKIKFQRSKSMDHIRAISTQERMLKNQIAFENWLQTKKQRKRSKSRSDETRINRVLPENELTFEKWLSNKEKKLDKENFNRENENEKQNNKSNLKRRITFEEWLFRKIENKNSENDKVEATEEEKGAKYKANQRSFEKWLQSKRELHQKELEIQKTLEEQEAKRNDFKIQSRLHDPRQRTFNEWYLEKKYNTKLEKKYNSPDNSNEFHHVRRKTFPEDSNFIYQMWLNDKLKAEYKRELRNLKMLRKPKHKQNISSASEDSSETESLN